MHVRRREPGPVRPHVLCKRHRVEASPDVSEQGEADDDACAIGQKQRRLITLCARHHRWHDVEAREDEVLSSPVVA